MDRTVIEDLFTTKHNVELDAKLDRIRNLEDSDTLNDVVARQCKMDLIRNVLMSTAPGIWFQGEALEVYLKLVAQSLPIPVEVWSTFFYTSLKINGDEKTRLSYRKTFENSLANVIYLPCLFWDNHWVLCVVDCRKGVIHFYDSLAHKLWQIQWQVELIKRGLKELNSSGHPFEVCVATGIPRQTNGVDCGPFVAAYGYCLMRSEPMRFSQGDMLTVRRNLSYELIRDHSSLKDPVEVMDIDPEMPIILTSEHLLGSEGFLFDEGECTYIMSPVSSTSYSPPPPVPSPPQTPRGQDFFAFSPYYIPQPSTPESPSPGNQGFSLEPVEPSLSDCLPTPVVRIVGSYKIQESVLQELRKTNIPFVDYDPARPDGNQLFTNNSNGEWRKKLLLKEILDELGEGAWDQIEAEMRINPGLFISWLQSNKIAGKFLSPITFRFARPRFLKRIATTLSRMHGPWIIRNYKMLLPRDNRSSSRFKRFQ